MPFKNKGNEIGKIIIAGDGAGANLAIGVSFLAAKRQIRTPDSLFLAYPSNYKFRNIIVIL